MNEIALYIGLGIFVIGGIAFLIAAFKTGLLWGFGCLLLPPVAIIYLFAHWHDAKGPLLAQIFGVAFIAFSVYAQDGINFPVSMSSKFSGLQRSPGTSYQKFKCDGRTHCSQMTSCAEAIYFLRNCPNTKMDGNYDGIPCERQWCRQ